MSPFCIHRAATIFFAKKFVLFRNLMLQPSQLKNDVLDVVWGIFDEDGDGRLTKAEFMDVRAHAAEC
jgi:hypothetical protein